MENKYILIRDVLKSECSWLQRDYKKGDVVYLYSGNTYGCCSCNGKAFTDKKDKTPFFELPNNSVERTTAPSANDKE